MSDGLSEIALEESRSTMRPFYVDESVTIYHADYRDALADLARAGAVLVFADPPYHVGIKYGEYDDQTADASIWGHALVRDLSPLAPLLVVTPGNVRIFDYPRPDYTLCRFDRTQQSPSGVAWMCKWEPIFVYGKVPQRLPWDVIETASQSERSRTPLDHPVPKPIALLHVLLEHWTKPGDLVVDPFLGSGTTLRAAKDLGRRGIGIEIDENYCGVAARRMGQEVLNVAV